MGRSRRSFNFHSSLVNAFNISGHTVEIIFHTGLHPPAVLSGSHPCQLRRGHGVKDRLIHLEIFHRIIHSQNIAKEDHLEA